MDVEKGANQRQQRRELESDHPHKLRIDLIEPTIDLIETPVHTRTQFTDVDPQS